MKAACFPRSRLWLFGSALSFVFLFSGAAFAQPAYPPPPGQDLSSASSWQRLQQLSLQLDSVAARTRSEAKVDSRHRGSDELAEKIDDFSREAHRFRVLMLQRNVPSSKINDEVHKLVDDARKVQQESAKADRHDPQTDADWNRTVSVLDEINREYMTASGLTPQGSYYPGAPAGPRPYPGTIADSRTTMLNDLDRRADDAARLSESANLEIAPEIGRLRDHLRTFRESVDQLSPDDTRANIAQMLSEARAAQADLSGSNAPPRLRDDVNALVGTLVQMRDLNTESVGTSGFGPPPPIGSDRYAAMDVAQLTRELDNRLSAASDQATRSDLDDVASQISRFRDRMRDFNANAAGMSPEDRRETLDNLLQDAQKTQRDLAGRHVSSAVMNQWNAVVDLLVRLRDQAE